MKGYMKNSKQRFSDRVENYIKYRPTYPVECVNFLYGLGISSQSAVADIGSGTGILSGLLIKNVKKLYGVEPNKEMRIAAEEKLKMYSNFISVEGSAEDTTLENNSIDFIIAAQAFHWFDIEKSLTEFRRILKNNGRLILIWNNRINNTKFLQGYEEALLNYATDYKEVNHQNLTDETLENCFVSEYKKTIFANSQQFDFTGLMGRLFSSSYSPAGDHPNHQKIVEEMERLFKKYNENGLVVFNYNTEVYSGVI